MIGVVGIKLNEGSVKIKEDVPPQGITVDLRIDKISKTDDPGLANISFSYDVNYVPKTGVIKLGGEALLNGEASVIEKMVKNWKKKKKLDEETAAIILNAINPYVSYNALLIMRVFNLPPHIAPPPIEIAKKEKRSK